MATILKICTDLYFGLCWTKWSADVSITDKKFAQIQIEEYYCWACFLCPTKTFVAPYTFSNTFQNSRKQTLSTVVHIFKLSFDLIQVLKKYLQIISPQCCILAFFLSIFSPYAPPFNFFLPVVRIYLSPFCTIQHMCVPQYHLFYVLWDRKKYLATLIIDNSRKYPVTEHILNMKEVTFYIFYLDECSSTSILSWK